MLRARHAVATRPFPGETLNGDLAILFPGGQEAADDSCRLVLGLVDGAGHGAPAHGAAALAAAYIAGHLNDPVPSLLAGLHEDLQGTRGAVAGLAVVNLNEGTLIYGGVGNIECRLLSDGQTRAHLISYNGLLGHTLPRVRTFTQPIAAGDMLVLHSDGISTHWQPRQYPGLAAETPAVVAAILLRDWGKHNDDATTLVVCFSGANQEGTV